MAIEPFRVALANSLRYEAVLRHRQPLDAAGVRLDVVDAPASDDEALKRFAGYQGIIYPFSQYRLSPFDRLPELIGIVSPTVGVDHIDLDSAVTAGVVVGHLPTFSTEQTADLAMFLIIGTVRRVPQILHEWREGRRAISEWEAAVSPVDDMRGAVLGLLGFGRIARAVAARAHPFGMHCIAYAPTVSDWELTAQHVRPATLESLFREADVISVHLPYTDKTHHLVDAGLINLMKTTAVLINTSRGPLVDEAALLDALRTRQIGGAGLDVFEHEPPTPDNPLLGLPNVLWTPHAGGSSKISIERVGEGSAEQMAWIAQGFWPRHVANPTVEPKVQLQHRGYPKRT